MQAVLLVVHLFACIALVISVMLQRSEGGALGMGGGGTGGIISGRGAANVLVRTTMVLATVFFVTSVVMTRLNAEDARTPTDLQRQLQQEQNKNPLDGLGKGAPATTPAAPPVTLTPDPLAPAGSPAPAPATTTTTAPATTVAPATRDPLAPTTTTTTAPATPAPATPAPTKPPTQ